MGRPPSARRTRLVSEPSRVLHARRKQRPDPQPAEVLTLGHSTRTLDDFLSLLRTYGVTQVVDVRKMPRSATNPQFNRETLPRVLRKAGIAYLHLPELGGLRRPRLDSPNAGWHNRSFQGYADYMQT